MEANIGKIEKMNKGVSNSRFTLGPIKKSGFVSASELATVDSVFGVWTKSDGDEITVNITQYTFVYQPYNGDAIVQYRKGPAIFGDMKERLNHATPGSKIFIGNVKANTPAGNVFVGETLQLEVK